MAMMIWAKEKASNCLHVLRPKIALSYGFRENRVQETLVPEILDPEILVSEILDPEIPDPENLVPRKR